MVNVLAVFRVDVGVHGVGEDLVIVVLDDGVDSRLVELSTLTSELLVGERGGGGRTLTRDYR